jgi:hypothetical protein
MVVAAVAFWVTVGACEMGQLSPNIGVRRSPSGLVASVFTCPDSSDLIVALLRRKNDVVGDQEDQTLWSVHSVAEPQMEVSIPIGTTVPRGFELLQPLMEEPTGQLTLTALWDSDLEHAINFRLSEVPEESGLILSDDGVVDTHEFAEAARARCG